MLYISKMKVKRISLVKYKCLFLSGDYLVNSPNLFSWLCIDIVGRNLMFVTLGTLRVKGAMLRGYCCLCHFSVYQLLCAFVHSQNASVAVALWRIYQTNVIITFLSISILVIRSKRQHETNKRHSHRNVFEKFLKFWESAFGLHKWPMQHLQVDFNLILGRNRWYVWWCRCLIGDPQVILSPPLHSQLQCLMPLATLIPKLVMYPCHKTPLIPEPL